jgi:AraC-like DNA-binding protein
MKLERYGFPGIYEDLPLWVKTVGSGSFEKGEEHSFPNPQYPRFFWCERGRGKVLCNSRWEELQANEMVFWSYMDGDQGIQALEDDWRCWWWTYTGPLVEELFKHIKLEKTAIIADHNISVKDMQKLMANNRDEPISRRFENSSFAYHLLSRIANPVKKEISDPIIENSLKTIEQNLGNPALSVNFLADSATINRFSLNRHFQKLLGISPVKYILQKRINHAIMLLNSTNKQIAEIAEECGFCDAAHFSKQFKAFTGQRPSDLRKEM